MIYKLGILILLFPVFILSTIGSNSNNGVPNSKNEFKNISQKSSAPRRRSRRRRKKSKFKKEIKKKSVSLFNTRIERKYGRLEDPADDFFRKYHLYVSGTVVYGINANDLGGVTGFEAAIGYGGIPLGFEVRLAWYKTRFASVGGELDTQSAFDSTTNLPKEGTDFAEERRLRGSDTAGLMNLIEILVLYRENFYANWNIYGKSGPVLMNYQDTAFPKDTYDGIGVSLHAGVEYILSDNIMLGLGLIWNSAVLKREKRFEFEEKRWRELPLRVLTAGFSTIIFF